MQVTIVFVIACLVLSVACKYIDTKAEWQRSTGTFVVEIPKDANGEAIRSFRYNQMLVHATQLQNLEQGFDSIQIRIWFSNWFEERIRLITIKYETGWTVTKNEVYPHVNPDGQRIDSVTIITSSVIPRSGFKKFIRRIQQLEIETMEDISPVTASLQVLHAGGVAVEFASLKKYRFYQYLNPSVYPDSIAAAKKMQRLIDYLQEELDFNWQEELDFNWQEERPPAQDGVSKYK